MRYAQIRELDISNGEGVGVALFVQGCHFHCQNCFNPDTWDFNGGKEWTNEAKIDFLKLVNRPYIKRVSILGGEPLAKENLNGTLDLVNEIRLSCPQKSIWLYSGYTWEQLFENDDCGIQSGVCENQIRRTIVISSNVFVDGQYIDSQRDITLAYCGSSNQRLINIQQSLQKGEIVLWQI